MSSHIPSGFAEIPYHAFLPNIAAATTKDVIMAFAGKIARVHVHVTANVSADTTITISNLNRASAPIMQAFVLPDTVGAGETFIFEFNLLGAENYFKTGDRIEMKSGGETVGLNLMSFTIITVPDGTSEDAQIFVQPTRDLVVYSAVFDVDLTTAPDGRQDICPPMGRLLRMVMNRQGAINSAVVVSRTYNGTNSRSFTIPTGGVGNDVDIFEYPNDNGVSVDDLRDDRRLRCRLTTDGAATLSQIVDYSALFAPT